MSTRLVSDNSRRLRDCYIFLLIVLVGTAITAMQFYDCVRQGRCTFAEDFEVFYTPARAMVENIHTSPYPVAQVKAWIDSKGADGTFHYSLYPPASLLLFYPLGYFSKTVGLVIWDVVQLAALVDALCILWPATTAKRWLSFMLFLPFLMMTIFAGQIGILCAALFALTLAWRNRRPLLAALALALLTLKPQLAIMLPVLLLYERNYKVLLMAALFCLLLAVATICLWGWAVWRDYFDLLTLSPQLLALAPPQLLSVSLSPALALRMLGLAAPLCLMLQTILSLIVIMLCWSAFKKASETALWFLVATATFLVSPYSFHYDAVILAFVAMMLFESWMQGMITTTERIALILISFIPLVAVKLQVMHVPYGFIAILTAFLVALHCVHKQVRS